MSTNTRSGHRIGANRNPLQRIVLTSPKLELAGSLDETPEGLARLFHETYERLAPEFGYETRTASSVPWENVLEPDRSLMVAIAAAVLATLDRKRYARSRRPDSREGNTMSRTTESVLGHVQAERSMQVERYGWRRDANLSDQEWNKLIRERLTKTGSTRYIRLVQVAALAIAAAERQPEMGDKYPEETA